MSGDSPRALARLVRGARQASPAAPAASPALLAAAVVVLLVLPGLGLPRLTLNLGASIVLFGLAATGLNLMLGYVGMLSLGGALYLGASGYIVALTTQLWDWPMLGALLAAIAGSLLLALILGFVLVGLSGHYFAVASLGLATALDALLVAFPQVTGGTSGLTMDRTLDLGVVTVSSDLGWYAVSVVAAVIGLLVFGWTVAGKRGRILRLVRADELAANVLGVRTFRIKLLVYVIAAFFAALAGALLFPFSGLVTPDSAGAVQSVQLVALIMVGGVGYRLGGFIGALVILWLQALVDTSGNWSLLIYAVVFLLVAFYAPSGIIGALRDGWDRLASHGPRPRHAAGTPAPVTAPGEPAAPAPANPGPAEAPAPAVTPPGRAATRDWRCGASPRASAASSRSATSSRSAGHDRRPDRFQRRRQVHAGQHDLRDRAAGRGRGHARRPGPDRNARAGAHPDGHRPDLPGAPAGGRADRRGQPGARRRPREVVPAAVGRPRGAGNRGEHSRGCEAALGDLADRRAGTLGTGERKFVELVRALIEEPVVCLLDEPAVGLSLDEIEHLPTGSAPACQRRRSAGDRSQPGLHPPPGRRGVRDGPRQDRQGRLR